MKKTIVVIVFILGLIGYSFYTNGSFMRTKEKAEVGSYAPDFMLTGVDGKEVRLSDIKKPVLVNFWASWCGPCRQEAPELIRLYDHYKGKFEILAVNITINDKEENARKFARFFGMEFPVLFDRDGSIAEKYRVTGFPTTVFIGEDKKIVYIANGLLPSEKLEEITQKMLDS